MPVQKTQTSSLISMAGIVLLGEVAPEIWTSSKGENLLPLTPKDGHNKEQEMAKGTRRKHSAAFKAQVALAPIAGE